MITLRPLVLAYAPSKERAHLSALFDLDEKLGRILSSTTEPMVGQIRLTWWFERLAALGKEDAVAEPALVALRESVAQGFVTNQALSGMVEGWEALLDPMPLSSTALKIFAVKRGNGMFETAGAICGRSVATNVGAGWALIDFAMRCSDEQTTAIAVDEANRYFANAKISGPKSLRILAHVARAKARQSIEQIRQPIGRLTILNAILH